MLSRLENRVFAQSLDIVAILLFQQLREESAQFLQLPVGSLLHNLAVPDNHNFIDVSKRTQAVRNHNHRASDNQLIQRAHDFTLGFHVHAGGWLVQDEDGRVSQDGARDGDALALTEREILPLLVDFRVIAAPVHNGLVNLRPFCCINNIFQVRAGPPYFDVVAEGSLEQHRLLKDDADILAQRHQRILAIIDAIDFHRAGLSFIETWNELDHRRLAAAGEANQGDSFASRNVQGNTRV